MRLSLSVDTIAEELDAAIKRLQGLRDGLDYNEASGDGGIPGVNTPGGSETQLLEWMVEFTGEVMLVARKCESLATTLAEPPGS